MGTPMKAMATLYILFACQVADWASTTYALGIGGIELNSLMRSLFDVSPLVALLPKVGVVAFAWLVYTRTKMLGWIVAATVLSALPVIWNMGQLIWSVR